MASDIKITSLEAVGTVGQVALSAVWAAPAGKSSLPYMQAANVEFWASATNNRSNAVKVKDTGPAGLAVHGGTADGDTRYYWARAVDAAGNAGEFFPASSTGGVPATAKVVTPGPGSITNDMLADGAVSKEKFVTGITPVEAVSALPATGNFPGRTVYFAGKLYRHVGSPAGAAGFTAEVSAGDLSGVIVSTQIADGAISTPKLATNSVVADKIAANAVSADNIVAGAVSAAKIASSAITADKINAGAVTAAKLAANSVSASSIQADAIRAHHIFSGSIEAGKLKAGSINTSELFVNGVLITDKIAANAVTDAVTFTGNGQQGTLASGNFQVTNGRILLMAAGFLDRPASNSANFGYIAFRLKYNGLTIKTFTSSYDDQSGYGVPLNHEFNLPSGTYNFSFHADNTSGPGQWIMLPGSTLTVVNLKR